MTSVYGGKETSYECRADLYPSLSLLFKLPPLCKCSENKPVVIQPSIGVQLHLIFRRLWNYCELGTCEPRIGRPYVDSE